MTTPTLDLGALIEATLDTTPATQDAAIATVEAQVMTAAQRPLAYSETVKIGMMVALAWNARGMRNPSEFYAEHGPQWFHTSDGRYFSDDSDRRSHQRTLDEARARNDARTTRDTDRAQAAD